MSSTWNDTIDDKNAVLREWGSDFHYQWLHNLHVDLCQLFNQPHCKKITLWKSVIFFLISLFSKLVTHILIPVGIYFYGRGKTSHFQYNMFITHDRNSYHFYEQFTSFDPHTIKTSCLLPMTEIHIIYMSNLYDKRRGSFYHGRGEKTPTL